MRHILTLFHPRVLRSQRGDTIVEVMIAITIVAAILTAAFIVVSTNSKNVRTAEEHAQAIELLQGQVELVRAKLSNKATAPQITAGTRPAKFCITDVSQPVYDAATAPECKVGLDKMYTVTVENTSTPNLYKFNITWVTANQSEVAAEGLETLYYKMYATI